MKHTNFSSNEQSSLSYTLRHLEPTHLPNETNEPQSLKTELAPVVYQEKDTIEINKDNYSLRFKYSPLLNDFVEQRKNIWTLPLQDPKHYRVLDSFILENKSTGYKIDMNDIVPNGYTIILVPHPERGESNHFNHQAKICVIVGDVAKWDTILSFLHEIGHVWFRKSNRFEQQSFDSRPPLVIDQTIEQLEMTLKAERGAWAFALKLLRHFVDNLDFFAKKEIKDAIHRSLTTYSDNIKLALMRKKIYKEPNKENRRMLEDRLRKEVALSKWLKKRAERLTQLANNTNI